jgi:hypothetical protein
MYLAEIEPLFFPFSMCLGFLESNVGAMRNGAEKT